MSRFETAGHRFGIVLAALPAIASVLIYLGGGSDSKATAIMWGVVALILYCVALGIGWVLSAIFD